MTGEKHPVLSAVEGVLNAKTEEEFSAAMRLIINSQRGYPIDGFEIAMVQDISGMIAWIYHPSMSCGIEIDAYSPSFGSSIPRFGSLVRNIQKLIRRHDEERQGG